MNTKTNPETPGLIHLTRLNSTSKNQDENNIGCEIINNNSVDTVSVKSNDQFNKDIIQNLADTSQNDISTEPERTYRSRSLNPKSTKTRLKSFSLIENQQLFEIKKNLNLQSINNWSFKQLKNEFKVNNFEKLFDKYQIRVQHNFFIVLLILNIAFNIIAIYLYYYFDKPYSVHYGVVLIRGLCIISNFLMLIVIFKSELYLKKTKSRILCSLLTLVLMITCEYCPSIYAMLHPPSALLLQRVRPTYFLILANHVFLPHAKSRHAFYCTCLVVIIETVLTIYSRFDNECVGSSLAWYTFADFIFHLTCSFIGYFVNKMLEVANRRTFLVYRSCIESKYFLKNQLQQQDDLLHTCIPKHLSERVKQDLTKALIDLTIKRSLPCKPFNELYIEKYNDVTILYADIVNSMALTANLSAQNLVITLNELFRRFDLVTEQNKCLRIKLLGDCYYCVCGVPDYQPNHADNCVKTGLSMLDIIKDVRKKSKVEVDMRIGIHTGMVMSGLMGLYKWQYDIWSLDSMKASEMEHSGISGMLHLSLETLNCLSYDYRDKLSIKERFNGHKEKKTYLVNKKIEDKEIIIIKPNNFKKDIRMSCSSTTIKKDIDTSFLTQSILKYREMINFVNTILETAIYEMPLTKREQYFNSKGIHPFLLLFRSSLYKSSNLTFFEMEKRFNIQTDTLFHYYVYCAGLICVAIVIIKYTVSQIEIPSKSFYIYLAAIAFILLSQTIVYLKKLRLNFIMRWIIWFLISIILTWCATIDLTPADCQVDLNDDEFVNCAFTWYYTYTMVLAITSVSIFIRISYFFKTTLYLIFFYIFCNLIYDDCSMVNIIDKNGKWTFFGHCPQIGHIYYVCIVTIILHLIDRQIEYILRLDFQWTNKLDNERKEAINLAKINRLLLLNILPEHLVIKYMCDQLWIAPTIPFSESYESVAVMFASIPNYAETYTENEMNGQGLKCLQILNEIIHDFDKIIFFNQSFTEVEKIKTIGSTYMAATGLQTKRESLNGLFITDENEIKKTVVFTMVDFAIEMLKKLKIFNKDALQELKLRIGIAVGPVVAGVIGASKPQYDIWGDTVNVASRMDSFGLCDKIHITQEVANILIEKPEYRLECRGEIEIKGKGKMVTYLLETDFDEDEF